MIKYSLISEENKTKKIITLPECCKGQFVEKEKVALSTIDYNTTFFENRAQLQEHLYLNKKIDSLGSNLYIEYQYGGTKKLPIVYSDSKVKSFAKDGITYVDTCDKEFNKYLKYFLNKCINKKYYNFILNKKLINNYTAAKIEEYLVNPEAFKHNSNDSMFLLEKIKKSLSNYKMLRDIIVNTESFEVNPDNLFSDINEELINVYNHGGMDEVYSYRDLDDIQKESIETQKILGLKY